MLATFSSFPFLYRNDETYAIEHRGSDYIYNEYHSMYGSIEKNTVCVVKLYRARIDDEGVVKKSTPLKSYHFGAQPPSTE